MSVSHQILLHIVCHTSFRVHATLFGSDVAKKRRQLSCVRWRCTINEPQREKTSLPSSAPNLYRTPKSQVSLHIRAVRSVFVVRMKKNWIFGFTNAPSEESDQTVRKRGLIWIFNGAHAAEIEEYRWTFTCLENFLIAHDKRTLIICEQRWPRSTSSVRSWPTLFRFKYTEHFTTKKGKFSEKNSDILHISAQNIDCGYSLEPPLRRNMKNNVYPYKPQFYYIKVGFKGVKII